MKFLNMSNQLGTTGPGPCLQGETEWRLSLDDGPVLHGFRRRGRRPVGLFIHGFRSDCDGEKSRRLSQMAGRAGADWLRYDQRGCGLSTWDFNRFTLGGAISDVHRVLESLDDPPCVLVGSSLGALIALHVAASRRRRVGGLVLIAPAVRFIYRELGYPELERWRQRGYRWFPDLYAGGCYRLDYTFCADALRYTDPPAELPCPVRVIHGTEDELLPLDDTREWMSGLNCPAAGLEIIDGGDHRLTGWSDVIARQTQTFWNEIDPTCA